MRGRELLTRSGEKFDRFGDGLGGDFVAGVCCSCLREKDEGALATGEFFVAGHFFKDGFGGDACGKNEGELEAAEEGEDTLAVCRGERGVFLGEEEGGPDAEGNRFAVKKFAIGKGGLDGVADGVAEVEEGAGAGGFPFVLFDNAGLDGEVAEKEVGGRRELLGIELGEVVEHGGVADGGVLDDFGKAFAVFARGKGSESGGVDEHEGRLVETTEEVFSFGGVDAGFASDGRVHLRDDSGGDLDDRDAAVVDGSDEAGKVPGDAASEGDHE